MAPRRSAVGDANRPGGIAVEHLVRFTTAEGRDGHHYAESLEAGLAFAERVRNSEEATDVRVYRLREVPIEFKTYVKVEIRGEDSEEDAAVPAPPSLPPMPDDLPEAGARPLVATAAAPEDAGDGSGRRLFQRG
jgi:hypothetical protein